MWFDTFIVSEKANAVPQKPYNIAVNVTMGVIMIEFMLTLCMC